MAEPTQISGIYCIENRATGRRYIGSAINFGHRKACHWCELRAKRHSNKALQAAWLKYGEDAFHFVIIEEDVPLEHLLIREQWHIDQAKANGERLYNMRPVAASQLGFKHSEESKRKMSRSRTGKKYGKYSPERVEKMRQSLIGRTVWNKGILLSEEQKVRLRGRPSPLKGIPRSEETKARMREGCKRRDQKRMQNSVSV